MFVEIIINTVARALNKTFDYRVPKELEKDIMIGSRVFVPFGNGNKVAEGYVIQIKNTSEFANKDIIKLEDSILTKENIELAKLMAMKYFCNVSDCIRLMLPPGNSNKDIEKRVKEKTIRKVYLNLSKEEIKENIDSKKIKSEKQIKLLNYLFENNGIGIKTLEENTCISKAIMKTLEKNGFIKFEEERINRNPFKNKNIQKDKKLVLNKEQKEIYNQIEFMLENNEFAEFLLYGITGAGKTEVYLQVIEKVLKLGKRAIVLVPEISLTPQMVDRFLARFGDCIAVLHSKLSNGERFDEWSKIQNGDAKIIIGARSAIFAPVKDLGVIIVDEEHDSSYKSDSTPRYDAKDLARYICKKSEIPLILGSATPDICDYYKAKKNEKELVVLTKRANSASLPNVEIIDLRNELAEGNRSMISYRLHEEIIENKKRNKQTILFLNRRGYSTFIMCRDCGYTVKCKNCNIAMTYHLYENKLKCHYCGYEKQAVKVCPECNSKNIKYFGTGTQKLENEIKKLFPDMSTIRMDIDTVSKKNSHEEILNKFKNENIDILIGTQMIVKGHHFPNVTLVGIIAADTSLNMGDYRAAEKTFQTITQVAGRAGRDKEQGKVILQTYNPDNYSIICGQKQDYELFFSQEIMLRKRLNYPPFCDIITIKFQSTNEKEIKKVSEYIYKLLQKQNFLNCNIYKPVPSPIDKINNQYRWRIIIKCIVTKTMINGINNILKQFYETKWKNTNIIVDINPNNMN